MGHDNPSKSPDKMLRKIFLFFTMIIPFLGVLFGTQERIVNPPEIINSIESFKNLFYYQISHTIESSGSAKALILICSVILISFLLS